MTKELSTNNKPLSLQGLISSTNVKEKFREVLGKNAPAFIASILQIANQNEMLRNAEPMTIMSAAMIAATLKLPINPNLGFAYIIPYNNRKANRQEAQFQMGYKGFIQLAQRSGQFKTISATPIYDGQIVESNPLKGYKFDFNRKASQNPIGFAAHFELLNGFEKTLYMTVKELEAHGGEYSQSARKGYGLWVDNFEAMALKTVLKLLLSKFAPLSIEMQTATITDQSVVKNADTLDVEYTDNTRDTVDLGAADLTKGLKIKGEKKPVELEATKPAKAVENTETEPMPQETGQETASGEEEKVAPEALEGEYQCVKCKDISTLTLDGKQDCQVCGAREWKKIGAAGKAMVAGMKKAKK